MAAAFLLTWQLPALIAAQVPHRQDVPERSGPASRAVSDEPAPSRRPSQSRKPLTLARQIVVDLSHKETVWPLPSSAELPNTCITDVQVKKLPVSYRLDPDNGIISAGRPLDVVLEQPSGVLIRLSLARRNDRLVLRVAPRVEMDHVGTIDFTQERIQRCMRSVERQLTAGQRRLTAARREHRRIEVWLATPGNKPLDLVKGMRLKLKLLQSEAQALQSQIPFVLRYYANLHQLSEFVERVHETAEIHFVLHIGRTD